MKWKGFHITQPLFIKVMAITGVLAIVISFFMYLGALMQPAKMKLSSPTVLNLEDKPAVVPLYIPPMSIVPYSNGMVIILSNNNRVFYYYGSITPELVETSFDKQDSNSIQRAIKQKQDELSKRDYRKNLFVFIKADSGAKYRQVVDILDEMHINEVHNYAIVDITPREMGLLKEYEDKRKMAVVQTIPAENNINPVKGGRASYHKHKTR